MGLRTDVQTDVAAAFDGDLADAVKSFTLKQYNRGQYNPATGDLSGAAYPNEYTSRGVFADYEQPEVLNSAIEPGDVQVIVLQNELEVTPRIADVIVESSVEYRVIGIGKDPADAIWQIHVRSTQ